MSAVIMRNTRAAEEPVEPPTHDDNTLYPFCMYFNGAKDVAFADEPGDLLAVLAPGYETLDFDGQLKARIALAIRAQTACQAMINAEVTPQDWATLSPAEQEVLNGPRFEQPHNFGGDEPGDVWSSDIPLILVETGYAPYTDLARPISGIADVIDPPNIHWIRPLDEWEFLVSLANIGFIVLQQAADL